MAASTTRYKILPGLAEHINLYVPLYREISVKNKTYFNVRTASDAVDATQGFLAKHGIREKGMSLKDLALCECDKLLRSNILVLADRMQYQAIRRDPNFYIYVQGRSRG